MRTSFIKIQDNVKQVITFDFIRTNLKDNVLRTVYQADLNKYGFSIVIEIYLTRYKKWIGKIINNDGEEILSTGDANSFKATLLEIVQRKINIIGNESIVKNFTIRIFTPNEIEVPITIFPIPSNLRSNSKNQKNQKAATKKARPMKAGTTKKKINISVFLKASESETKSLLCRHGVLAVSCPYCSY